MIVCNGMDDMQKHRVSLPPDLNNVLSEGTLRHCEIIRYLFIEIMHQAQAIL